MKKLEQAAREVIRQHSTECLSDNTVDALREALAEQERKAKYDERFERLDKFEQAEQEPVAFWNGKETAWFEHELCGHPAPDGCTIPLYAAPVRTKDLTDEDKLALWKKWNMTAAQIDAVIAADREKNK